MTGTDRNMAETYEVVVVGGGTAGLSAALVLGRARRRTLVVDAGEPRNAPAAHMQGYLSRDGMPPAEFLAEGRREVARYGVELVRDRAVDVVQGRRRRSSTSRSGPGHRPRAPADRHDGLWSTSCRTFAGRARRARFGRMCCTARTATAGRSATRPSACWPRRR